MFLFLTVLQAIVAAALVGVILMQRSEGGGLGIGGSPSGMFSARGAADFLTRSTRWLAVAFVALSIALAVLAVSEGSSGSIESSLDRTVSPAAPADPLGAAAPAPGSVPVTEPAPSTSPSADPLSGAAR